MNVRPVPPVPQEAESTKAESTTADSATTESTGAVFARIRARIAPDLGPEALDRAIAPTKGDHVLNAWDVDAAFLEKVRTAAVLVGLVDRPEGLSVLLTRRTAALRDHAGQVAFPGGKMDPEDTTPAATALREAREEIGLPPDRVEVLGYMEPYLTRTGFRIVPVVAKVTPPFDIVLNPAEVVESFEVPFAFLMSEANHELRERSWQGRSWQFYVFEHGERMIWGITAGMIRGLYEKLYL